MTDYSIYYKSTMPIHSEWELDDCGWDLFISAYSPADRVTCTFKKACAKEKYWLVFPDYEYSDDELPEEEKFISCVRNEAEYIASFWEWVMNKNDWVGKRICIDITGFIRPYLIFLIKWLKNCDITKFDIIYSEPAIYSKRENTYFSDNAIAEVRQVDGYEGAHLTDTSNDVMIIGVGYEEHLISHAAENKANARKIQLFGFPSLSADMYQENVLMAQRAEEEVGAEAERHFAPANDPFVTANVIKSIVDDLRQRNKLTNLYLCPLSTKAQALGFSIYYLNECQGLSVSMIYPYSESYSKETSSGISRVWKYTVEL